MAWFWPNLPFIALIFTAVLGVPPWLVIRHPDAPPMTIGSDLFPQARPAARAASSTAARPAPAERVAA